MKKALFNRDLADEMLRLAWLFKIVAVQGPRHSGKATLCKSLFPDYDFFTLDDASVVAEISQSPKSFLKKHGKRGVILDEAQKCPELFPYLKIVSDEEQDVHFALTGSSNFLLLASIAESLAGRVALATLLPFSLSELGKLSKSDTNTLLFNGGFPQVWAQKIPARDVARNYYNTYIERDLRQIVQIKDLNKFQTFIRLCAGRIGSEFNAQGLSGEVGVSFKTIQEWLSVLEASYIIFRLPPFFQNIGKRLVKKPKIYFCDTALVCFLLGIETPEQLETHPLRGAIFENYVILEFLKRRFNSGNESNLYFYRDQSQHEVDLIQEFGWNCRAWEIKSATAFHSEFTRNLDYLKKLLGDRLLSGQVIYDGENAAGTRAVNFRELTSLKTLAPGATPK